MSAVTRVAPSAPAAPGRCTNPSRAASRDAAQYSYVAVLDRPQRSGYDASPKTTRAGDRRAMTSDETTCIATSHSAT
jgi:hypothetical protein